MLLWVTASGVVQVAQVVHSAGSSNLDTMCLNGVVTRQLKPHTDDGTPTSRWVTFTLGMMMGLPHKQAQVARAHVEVPIPILAHDHPFELAAVHDAANGPRPATVCALHVLVSASGSVDQIDVTRSTGSPPLDAACVALMRTATFAPAQRDNLPIAATTDIWLNWQSPN